MQILEVIQKKINKIKPFKNFAGLGESATKSILSKILAALEFIHSECLVHRAIRAENILIGDPGKFTRVYFLF